MGYGRVIHLMMSVHPCVLYVYMYVHVRIRCPPLTQPTERREPVIQYMGGSLNRCMREILRFRIGQKKAREWKSVCV